MARRFGVALAALAIAAAGTVLAATAASAAPSLGLDKDASLQAAQPGQEFVYTLVPRCSGLTEACVDATVTDPIPPEIEITSLPQSTSERTVTFDPATRLLTIEFRVLLPAPSPPASVGLPGRLVTQRRTRCTDPGGEPDHRRHRDHQQAPFTATGPFSVAYRCSVTPENADGTDGDPVEVDSGTFQLAAGQSVTRTTLPARAQCAIWETDSAGLVSDAPDEANAKLVTIPVGGQEEVPVVVITNSAPPPPETSSTAPTSTDPTSTAPTSTEPSTSESSSTGSTSSTSNGAAGGSGGPTPGLCYTGFPLAGVSVLAAGLLAAGLVLLLSARRRSGSRRH